MSEQCKYHSVLLNKQRMGLEKERLTAVPMDGWEDE